MINRGIPKKISSLSIPLGATVNMDGTCIHLAIFALALARTYGVENTGKKNGQTVNPAFFNTIIDDSQLLSWS